MPRYPALYDVMFTRSTRLRFGQDETPAPLAEAYAELRAAVDRVAGERDTDAVATNGSTCSSPTSARGRLPRISSAGKRGNLPLAGEGRGGSEGQAESSRSTSSRASSPASS